MGEAPHHDHHGEPSFVEVTRGPASSPDRNDPAFRPGEMPAMYGDTASVLIVDDDAALTGLLARLLDGEGYRCTIAADAGEARARAAESSFALALIDVLMPGESGLELAAALLAQQPHLSVVMVSGVDDPTIAEVALRSGAEGYVLKPFSLNQVVIAVNQASHQRCRRIEAELHVQRLEHRVGQRGGGPIA